MTSEQRRAIRADFTSRDFVRVHFTDDRTGEGTYSEGWRHPDGTVVLLTWGKREGEAADDDRRRPPSYGAVIREELNRG